MDLLTFLRRETPLTWSSIFSLALLAGLANAVIITVINVGAAEVSDSAEASPRLLVMFALAMGFFVIAKKAALGRGTAVMEGMLAKLRIRIIDKIRSAELQQVERLGRGELFAKISQDMSLISQSSFILLRGAQDVLIVVFCLGYLLYLFPPAMYLTVVAVGLGTGLYFRHRRRLMEDLDNLASYEASLLDSLSHVLDGFKEIRLNTQKSDSVFSDFRSSAESSSDVRVRLHKRYVVDLMFSSVFSYLLLAAVIFVMPRFVVTYGNVVIQIVAILLFLVGPLQAVVGAAPMLSQTNAALRNLYALEARVDSWQDGAARLGSAAAERLHGFETILFEGLTYEYKEAAGQTLFALGPLDFEIKRGEVIFISGGNGSGKSTLLKVLTGLYPQSSGIARVDGQVLDRAHLAEYREMISAIFADFHLFERLHGLDEIEPSKVDALLRNMKLENKTDFVAGSFTHSDLSSGQRKRLAMVVALLEDREILIFDEWAADQDREFRRYFYEELLPELKAQGKTVIVASHDDRYFSVADRVINLELGHVV